MWKLEARRESGAIEAEVFEAKRMANELGITLRLFKEMIRYLDIKQGAVQAGLLTEEEDLPCYWINPGTKEVEVTTLSQLLDQTLNPKQVLTYIKKAVDREPEVCADSWGALKKAASELHQRGGERSNFSFV